MQCRRLYNNDCSVSSLTTLERGKRNDLHLIIGLYPLCSWSPFFEASTSMLIFISVMIKKRVFARAP